MMPTRATVMPARPVVDLTPVPGPWPLLVLISLLVSADLVQLSAAPNQPPARPIEMVLVEAATVTRSEVAQWKREGFKGVALVLDERANEQTRRAAAGHISEAGLELYCWIEVARNAKLAKDHPRWMATLGTHEDWQKNFPKSPEPGVGQVAKAFPWVPICYREAYDAQLERIEQLLKRAPPDCRGLLLNDLQAGPSSCGCGNLQCRWAVDYRVHSTATKLEAPSVAAQFVAQIRSRTPDKAVIPVWTTECEEVDLPADKHQGRPGTGLCGTVGCATGACPDVFSKQWSALVSAHDGPVALLALHTTLQRTQKEFGGGPGWLTNAIAYLNRTLPSHGAKMISPDRLWVVVEGLRADEEATARESAAQAGVGAVIVARCPIDQSYEPRLISTK